MFIIILGGANDASGNLASFTLERINIFYTIFESLKKDNPKVILSGGYRFSKVSHCELVKKYLMKGPGIQIEKEFIENNNTVDEAINIAHYFKDINYRGRIIIITSSWHLRRAQYLFNATFADMTDIELIWKATDEINIDLEVIEKRKHEQIMNHPFGKWKKFLTLFKMDNKQIFSHNDIKKKIQKILYIVDDDDDDNNKKYNSYGCKLDNIVVHTKKKFIYFKISKTAGNSLHRLTLDKIYQYEPRNVYFDARSKEFKKWLNGCTDLNTYFKFSVVRNSYARVVSLYTHNLIQRKGYNAMNDNTTFEEFLEIFQKQPQLNNYSQLSTISIDDKIFLDYIGYFENLSDVWSCLKRKGIISDNSPIPYTKSLSRKHLLNDTNKQKIKEMLKKEIDFFKFS